MFFRMSDVALQTGSLIATNLDGVNTFRGIDQGEDFASLLVGKDLPAWGSVLVLRSYTSSSGLGAGCVTTLSKVTR